MHLPRPHRMVAVLAFFAFALATFRLRGFVGVGMNCNDAAQLGATAIAKIGKAEVRRTAAAAKKCDGAYTSAPVARSLQPG